LSVVSVWEAVIKHRPGKLPLPEPAESYLARLGALSPLHREPFDRMLVCQALQRGLVVATVDDAVRQYPVATL
jgi:PIN domain nuclease of toxin-antitoxin system